MTEQQAAAPETGDQPQLSYFERRPAFALLVVVAALALIGASEQPYEYYIALRAIVTGAAAFVIFHAVSSRQYGWLALAAFMVIVFAPAQFVTFDRSAWVVIDVLVAAALVAAGATIPRGPDGEENFFGRNFTWWKVTLLGLIPIVVMYSLAFSEQTGLPIE